MRRLGRILRGSPKPAASLGAELRVAIRATALTPRSTWGGHTETAEYARRRGLMDVALAAVMRDGLLRVSEAAALRWGDVELSGDGSGRIRIRSRRPTRRPRARCYTWDRLPSRPCCHPPRRCGDRRVHAGLRPSPGHHPAEPAAGGARAVGIPGSRDISGHSGRVGMAQDLSAAGFALPELMTAGRWKSPRMPARYTERQSAGRGAVARYYQGSRG